jgi:hypothetical protein
MPQDSLKEDGELRRSMAFSGLREGWRRAEECGASSASEEDIQAEIDRIRRMPEDESECP